jgi:hypothetical protein
MLKTVLDYNTLDEELEVVRRVAINGFEQVEQVADMAGFQDKLSTFQIVIYLAELHKILCICYHTYLMILIFLTQAKELVNRNTYPPLVIYIKECSSRDTGQGISQQEYIPSSCHLY